MPIYPITFSIPEEKIISIMPKKTKLISSLVPGDTSTYVYNTESEYYKEYQSSIFALTMKKAGWDCLRHYEIVANGALPYFKDIENCPKNTLALWPKDLLVQINQKYKQLETKVVSNEDTTEIANLMLTLFNHLKNHLTTKKMAHYILERSGNTNAKKILYLSSSTFPDYLRCLTLEGFKELLGANVHDYPMIPHIYKLNNLDYSSFYGKGMTYTNILDESFHDYERDKTIEQDIINLHYDLIIYGSYHRGMPFYNLVSQVYPPDKIILLCGEDEHSCNYHQYDSRGHHIFIREI
jgi:hypothetical protein